MKVGIIGAGAVGQAIGKIFQTFGNDVIFTDIKEGLLDKLSQRYYVGSYAAVIQNSDIIFVTVPTPSTRRGRVNLDYMKDALLEIAEHITRYKIIVIKSTIPPGTTENLFISLLESRGLNEGKDFDIVVNPEFLRMKHAIKDFIDAPKIVLGVRNNRPVSEMLELYSPFNTRVVVTNWKTAEMIKYANNAFYSTRISFFNEIAKICEDIDVSATEVIQTILMSKEDFGSHGKEFGHAFGGSCLPKDLDGLISFCEDICFKPHFLESVREVNKEMKKYDKLQE